METRYLGYNIDVARNAYDWHLRLPIVDNGRPQVRAV